MLPTPRFMGARVVWNGSRSIGVLSAIGGPVDAIVTGVENEEASGGRLLRVDRFETPPGRHRVRLEING